MSGGVIIGGCLCRCAPHCLPLVLGLVAPLEGPFPGDKGEREGRGWSCLYLYSLVFVPEGLEGVTPWSAFPPRHNRHNRQKGGQHTDTWETEMKS